MSYPTTGSWVRILPSCPWPERRGLNALVVTDNLRADVYPRHGLGKNEAIVRIASDPLDPTGHYSDRPWTCVIDARHLAPSQAPHTSPNNPTNNQGASE